MDGQVNKRGHGVLLQLFLNTLYISAFTFGGGFVIVSFMKKIFVDKLGWITEEEMLDITALAESSPGAIAVNAAILVGWHLAGLAGMLTAVAGTIIPPMTILTAVSFFYKAFASNRYIALFLRGMQAGVAAIILDVVWGLAANVIKQRSILYDCMIAAAFIAAFFFRINVIYLIIAAILLGIIRFFVSRREEAGR